jgi:urease accessory protein
MIISEKLGNVNTLNLTGLKIDYVYIEWFEATKRIQRYITEKGMDIAIRFLREDQYLTHGDVLYKDAEKAVVINIKPSQAIVISPTTLLEMGTVCYEIGNKHLPLFIQGNQVLIPYEEPFFRWLCAGGYNPKKEMRQLLNRLKSNIEPHSHNSESESLFSKIINREK